MQMNRRYEPTNQDREALRNACAQVRKESVLLRNDAQGIRNLAEEIRTKCATLRALRTKLIKSSYKRSSGLTWSQQ